MHTKDTPSLCYVDEFYEDFEAFLDLISFDWVPSLLSILAQDFFFLQIDFVGIPMGKGGIILIVSWDSWILAMKETVVFWEAGELGKLVT